MSWFMLTLTSIAVIVFFFLMGIVGLATPERISVVHGQAKLTPEGRNEVRVVDAIGLEAPDRPLRHHGVRERHRERVGRWRGLGVGGQVVSQTW